MTPTTLTDPTAAALLRAMLERPGDDLCRLVFADWLTENGEEDYGDFIRVQVELAECRPCRHPRNAADICRGCALRRREREIGEKYAATWIREMLGKG